MRIKHHCAIRIKNYYLGITITNPRSIIIKHEGYSSYNESDCLNLYTQGGHELMSETVYNE